MTPSKYLLPVSLCISLFLGNCKSDQTLVPSLSDDKIARIMADLAIADAATTGLSGYVKDSLMHVYFKQVFDIHGVSDSVYEADLRILAKDLPRMEMVVKKADELLLEKGGIPSGSK